MISVVRTRDFHFAGQALSAHRNTQEDIKDFLARLRKIHDTYYPGSRYLFPDIRNPKKVINSNIVYHFYSRMCRKLGIHLCREAMKGPPSFRRIKTIGVTGFERALENVEKYYEKGATVHPHVGRVTKEVTKKVHRNVPETSGIK